ncbi:VWA domain-containing protein [Bacillus dakarensis]|uniref:VWA domain-containing protein n=1 Tax=Robertmurraya dakarensis TaxID=1926278 RepID=UPI000981A825|nr:VWA domain-containing protein [Bacillus dakarensis]
MVMNKKWLLIAVVLSLFVGILIPSAYSAGAVEGNNGCNNPNRGLDIVFVLDNSGTILVNDPDEIRFTGSMNLVNSLHEYDRASVIKFDDEAVNLQSLTNNRYFVQEALYKPIPYGGTDMSTGISEALAEFSKNSGNNHKIMIVLTDGHSINNSKSLELAQQAYEENITIYTIGLGHESAIDVSTLTEVAEKTGGQYFQAIYSANLINVFDNIRESVEDLRGPKVYSDWTLTDDLYMDGDLVLYENMKMDLNGYDVEVEGDLVLLSCSEMRAVSGTIQAGNLEQEAGSTINLNNSQLEANSYTQDGFLRVNGEYGTNEDDEVLIQGNYNQLVRGGLDLNGFALTVVGDLVQEGNFNTGGGFVHIKKNMTQKGWFDLNHGELLIDGNLDISGSNLIDDQFKENKSLNVNGGYIQVGTADSRNVDSTKGDVIQNSGQLYVNNGTVNIFGNYTIHDGWLTMIHGSMDTTSDFYTEKDGDYVHVHGDFTVESSRNHAERLYPFLGKPMNDQAHLTDGVLQIEGNFKQVGDKQAHAVYSDRSQNYEKDYSRFNFVATGRHKVLLTGNGNIEVEGYGFHFNILELEGRLVDYPRIGPVRWDQLIESSKSANTNLHYLSINDIPVKGFNPEILNYDHAVPASTITGPLASLKVDARAEDHGNATVEITGNTMIGDKAVVKILVTAQDGESYKVYTVNVMKGDEVPGKVTSIELDRSEQTFIMNGPSFSPERVTLGYTVFPTNAENQKVIWTSTNPAVATVGPNGIVTPVGVGETTIMAETEDGSFFDSVNVKVMLPFDLLEGIKTLADFVEDTDRYNNIMALYDPSKLGIVVPGEYIDSIEFIAFSYLVNGTITTNPAVSRIEVSVNDLPLSAQELNDTGTEKEFLFNRAGLQYGDKIEVIAFNSAGDELERIMTEYPVDYSKNTFIPYGFHSIKDLLSNPILFEKILEQYSLDELRFILK